MTVRILVDTLGRQYVSRRKSKPCVQCGETIRRRGSGVRYCSRECFYGSRVGSFPNRKSMPQDRRPFTCGTCGKPGSLKPSAIRATGNYCSRSCAAVTIIEKTARRGAAAPTSLERLLYNALHDSGVKFEPQKRFGRFVADAFVPSLGLVIEVDGEYWHSLPMNQARDKRKDAALGELGLKVFRIPERDARADMKAAFVRGGICQ